MTYQAKPEHYAAMAKFHAAAAQYLALHGKRTDAAAAAKLARQAASRAKVSP